MKNILAIIIFICGQMLYAQITNIALNKPTATDSYFEEDNNIGNYAVDGDRISAFSRWASANTPWPHWIEVDLQGNFEISQLKFWTGYDGIYRHPVQYLFQYWDGNNWITIVDGSQNTSPIVDESFSSITTSKVRLFGMGGVDNYFRLPELQVYGIPSNNNNNNTAEDSTNVFVGDQAGQANDSGKNNTFIGSRSGYSNVSGNSNVFIGNESGANETGSNKLYIENSDSATPLIYGDFATDQLGINTNSIPDGYNFAVEGSAHVNGIIKSARGIFDSSSYNDPINWIPLSIGREYQSGRRSFEFVVSPNDSTSDDDYYLGIGVTDKNKVLRHNYVASEKNTWITLKKQTGREIFKVAHVNTENEDFAYIQMPNVNSKVVIGGWSGYLAEQGHKFIVQDGTAMIEDGIFTNGRIAIGTTEADEDYKLTVKGKIHVQEVKVDLQGAIAPDYVFYEDYKLRTLKEVQEYISKEGHLPNIPSAKEMEKEGVNLKEMNLKLLEKIEELTLYTIAQEKAIKKQNETNNKLEERLQKIEALLNK